MLLMSNPPKLVYDETGQLIEVILSASDYRAYLQTVAAESDWESLPAYLQDAIDLMLIDEVRAEKPAVIDFDTVVSGKATGV
jgi:hypothetical protein